MHEDNSMNTVQIELDRELVNVLQLTPGRLEDTLKDYLVLALYWRHEISSGKAAELLGMRLVEFLQYASRLGIPYIDMDEEELKAEIEAARKFAQE
jgi:predicted HTH domain antitoxin